MPSSSFLVSRAIDPVQKVIIKISIRTDKVSFLVDQGQSLDPPILTLLSYGTDFEADIPLQ